MVTWTLLRTSFLLFIVDSWKNEVAPEWPSVMACIPGTESLRTLPAGIPDTQDMLEARCKEMFLYGGVVRKAEGRAMRAKVSRTMERWA